MTEEPTAGLSAFVSPQQPTFHSNRDVPIDLTNDDSDGSEAYPPQPQAKRARLDTPNDFFNGHANSDSAFRLPPFSRIDSHNPFMNFEQRSSSNPSTPSHNQVFNPFQRTISGTPSYFVPYNGPTPSPGPSRRPSSTPDPSVFPQAPPSRPQTQERSGQQVIDLTGSPSPPPQHIHQSAPPNLPSELPPRTPVCIGQLTVTALVLYPIPYIGPQDRPGEPEWASVRLQFEHNPNKPRGSETTINIRTPPFRAPNGEILPGEAFAVVEQKVATSIGPMIGKGLIRVDALVKRGPPGLPILPLQLLVYTPKGNIPVVGDYLRGCELLLDHPSPIHGAHRNYHYHNPHNPPPGGHSRVVMAQNRLTAPTNVSRWTNASYSGKSVEVQRSQIDEMFKSLKDGDDLTETEPAPEVATPLYPHQKKALTFLLEREREQPGPDGKFTSLWQGRIDPMNGRRSWVHAVTSKEVFEEPREVRGSILADDMGLGKTISCVSLLAATLPSAKAFAATPLETPTPPMSNTLDPTHFAGAVWGMPPTNNTSSTSSKAAAKEQRALDRAETEYRRACQIKVKSRATLIICPLSTVANWEDQFREHWRGEVTVVGGGGNANPNINTSANSSSGVSTPAQSLAQLSLTMPVEDGDLESKPAPSSPPPQPSTARHRQGTPLRIYIYHGNARRPDPKFLADFDAVITTYATLASEYSRQKRSALPDEDEDEGGSSEGFEVDGAGDFKSKAKKGRLKRKLSTALAANASAEATSALQSIHWFRVVLDEAHSIKETATVASHASCNLMADRRLCLTGTPVQNKLDDVYALIKFLRVEPLDDKNVWTEFIGSPVKFGQSLGIVRLQTIMKCVTLRRTKETKDRSGKRILTLPPRRDELRYLKFDTEEQAIYDQFFNESKAEFAEMSNKNEVMKNYVGILQKILRLRQICDHFELVQGKEPSLLGQTQDGSISYETLVADIAREGLNDARAAAVFTILKESATTQCVECAAELCVVADADNQADALEDGSTTKRGKKTKGSRTITRASSPSAPRIVLTRCQHLYCIECYRNSCAHGWPDISPETRQFCSICQAELSPLDVVEIRPEMYNDNSSKKKTKKKDKKAKNLSVEHFRPSTKVTALLSDLITFSKGNPYSQNYDASSIEVQMVDNQGNQLDEGIVKTVVFSQWTSMLDKVEDALMAAGIRFERLDGTMKRDDRTKAMDALKYDPSCEVLLVSLKAGGVGLNLTAAQRVYLMDPYWNPAVENQAVDRIHRLGQTRPVTTIKLIIEGSIEARLLEVQRKKTELANMTLGHGQHTKAEILKRRLEELNQLFDH